MDPLSGCDLQAFPRLRLWVQPGGSSDNQTLAIGPKGRDNILNFAARSGASVYATCAGYYYSAGAELRRRCSRFAMPMSSTLAGSYWWFEKFYPSAWMMHLWPTVEGPISPIAVCAQPCSRSPRRCCHLSHVFCRCSYPAFAPTPLSNDLSALYWGGPALGLNKTTAAIPNGATVLAYFAHAELPRDTIPAVIL
jgi:hypothetical protein